MQMIYTDTPTDKRGQELFTKMQNSPEWNMRRFKKVQRENAQSFTIGFDIILQKKTDDTKYIFLSMRETNAGATKTFHYKEQQTSNFSEAA